MKKNLFRFFNDSSDGIEDRTKFIQKRVQIVQKYVPILNSAVKDYLTKKASLMDSSDRIASVLENYAKSENVTTGIKEQLMDYANILYDVGGNRNAQIKSMEANLLSELTEYGKMCKNVQGEMKCFAIAADKEKIRMRQLRRAQEDHADDRQQISLAEAELMKARGESTRSSRSLEEQIDIFERRRLNGLREVLLSWAVAELRFHARALELFTDAYNAAAKIDIQADMEEFRTKLRAENTPRLDSSQDTSFQRSDSLLQLLAIPFLHKRGENLTGIGIPHPSPVRASATTNSSSGLDQSI